MTRIISNKGSKTPLSKWHFELAAIFQDGRQKVTLYVLLFKMGHRCPIWIIFAL